MKEINKQLNEQEYLEYIKQWRSENKELIDSGKCKKVFLECLPICNHNGGSIDWKNSIKYKVYFIYNNINGFILIEDYKYKARSEILIRYKNNKKFMFVGDFKNSKIGSFIEAKRILRKGFEFDIDTILKNNNQNLIITDRKLKSYCDRNGKKHYERWYKYTCNKCGWTEGWIREHHLKNTIGCSACSNPVRKLVLGINTIYDTDPWMIPIVGEQCAKTHTHGSSDRVKVICPDCGRIKNRKMTINHIYKMHSINCLCGDGFSYGHKYIHNLLMQLKQNFIENYTFDWCKFYNPYKKRNTTGEYDFVLEDIKIIIEVDGDFHRKDNNMSGQTVKESKYLDDKKDRLANQYEYNVIRISDEKDIKHNILESDLGKIFNLLNIDWFKCEEFALSNRVKEACNLRKNNSDLSTIDIGRVMNLSQSSIINYLKKGNDLGWCNYNSTTEVIKKNSNEIIIFKNELLFGLFQSAKQLERQSENLLGVKLLQGNISKVCRAEKESYKGFKFKYIKDLTTEEYIKYDIENKLKELELLN